MLWSPCSLGFCSAHFLICSSFQMACFPGLRFPGLAPMVPRHVFFGHGPDLRGSDGRFLAHRAIVGVVPVALDE
eukprot:1210617-Heterocapsa_arctica.AAC.1